MSHARTSKKSESTPSPSESSPAPTSHDPARRPGVMMEDGPAVSLERGTSSKAASPPPPQRSGEDGLVQRLCASCAANPARRVQCPTCSGEDDAGARTVQRMPVVTSSNDPYEDEADTVARSVAAGRSAPRISPISLGRSPTPERVQSKREGDAGSAMPSAATALQSKGGGAPMIGSTRRRLEQSMDVDLGHVRVHEGPRAASAAASIQAKAFTHGPDIWLGAGASQSDVSLMAHEATHVVQQAGGSEYVQRAPQDYQHPEDGRNVRTRLQETIEDEAGTDVALDEAAEEETASEPGAAASDSESSSERAATTSDARAALRNADREAVREKKQQTEGKAKPDVNRPEREKPTVDQSAQATRQTAEQPSESISDKQKEKTGASGPEAETKGKTQDKGRAGGESAGETPLTLAQQAFSQAAAIAPPPMPRPASPVLDVAPEDAAGMPLPSDPALDARVEALSERVQMMREGAFQILRFAAEQRQNAFRLQGNVEAVSERVRTAEQAHATAQDHTTYRREVLQQAEDALVVSKEKAATVAAEAPTYVEKSSEGEEDAGPVAGQAQSLQEESADSAPDDAEAASKSREQSSKMADVSSGAGTMHQAILQTKARAQQLSADAEAAAQTNEDTESKLTESRAQIDRVDAQLTQMTEGLSQARSQAQEARAFPGVVRQQSDALEARGRALMEASFDFEQRLNRSQRSFRQGMKTVPALKPFEPESGDGASGVVQRQPADAAPTGAGAMDEGRYDDRARVDLASSLPGWATGIDPASAEQQENARQREMERRRSEVEQIEQWSGGKFEDLDAADKMGVALRLVGQNYYNTLANIEWPGIGKVAQMLLDPRGLLLGVVGGLSMILGGGANLLSAEQWSRDPVGNLLKSAADIATGITIALGTITALAAAIAAIMTALIVVTLGAASPVAVPVISFSTTVMTTVGGWTIAVGKVALVLQALTLIKNLVDAATAETATDLQNQSDQIRSDVNQGGMIVLQVVGAKGAQAGIRPMNQRVNRIRTAYMRAGGFRARASQVAGGARQGLGRLAGAGRRLPGQAVTLATQAPGRLAAGTRRLPSAVAQTGRNLGRGVASGTRRLAEGTAERVRNAPAALAQGVRGTAKSARSLPARAGQLLRKAPERLRQTPGQLRERLGDARDRYGRLSRGEERLPEGPSGVRVPTTERSVRIGDQTHTLSFKNVGSGVRIFICSVCGPLDDELTQMIHRWQRITGKITDESDEGLRRLIRLREQVRNVDKDLNAGTINRQEAEGTLGEIKGSLEEARASFPIVDRTASEMANSDVVYTGARVLGKEVVETEDDLLLLVRNRPDPKQYPDVDTQTGPIQVTPDAHDIADWKKYADYYNDRVDALIDQHLAGEPLQQKPPRTYQNYYQLQGSKSPVKQGKAFDREAAAIDRQTVSEYGRGDIHVVEQPKIHNEGELYQPDQIYFDEHYNEVYTGSNKTRPVAFTGDTLSESVKATIDKDIDEIIKKYLGDIDIRANRGGLEPVYGGAPGTNPTLTEVDVAFLTYNTEGVSPKLQELILDHAQTRVSERIKSSKKISRINEPLPEGEERPFDILVQFTDTGGKE